MAEDDWDGADYAELAGLAPFDKPPSEYNASQRRGELYSLIEDAGHPRNIEKSQRELAERYGVSQPQISQDMDKIREFEAAHNGTRAKAVTSWLAERAVMSKVEAEEWEDAFGIQQEYVEYLFATGDLEESADKVEIEGDPGDAYMEMLRQLSEAEE